MHTITSAPLATTTINYMHKISHVHNSLHGRCKVRRSLQHRCCKSAAAANHDLPPVRGNGTIQPSGTRDQDRRTTCDLSDPCDLPYLVGYHSAVDRPLPPLGTSHCGGGCIHVSHAWLTRCSTLSVHLASSAQPLWCAQVCPSVLKPPRCIPQPRT